MQIKKHGKDEVGMVVQSFLNGIMKSICSPHYKLFKRMLLQAGEKVMEKTSNVLRRGANPNWSLRLPFFLNTNPTKI
jgi:hypothetical protein